MGVLCKLAQKPPHSVHSLKVIPKSGPGGIWRGRMNESDIVGVFVYSEVTKKARHSGK